MARFELSLPYILKHEGGWSDDPDDPGGPTNFGITLATAQRHGIMTKDALQSITQEQVARIYKSDYWRFDDVADQRVATKLFDMSVNFGLKTAVTILQRILLSNNPKDPCGRTLVVDGKFGPMTLAATNARTPNALLDSLCLFSAEHYKAIVTRRPLSAKYLKGWLKRAAWVPNA